MYNLGMREEIFCRCAKTTSSRIPYIVQSKQVSLLKRGEMGVNRYFSVFRDPRESRDGWKRGMPVGDIDRVMDVVCDSEAFEFGLKSGTWS